MKKGEKHISLNYNVRNKISGWSLMLKIGQKCKVKDYVADKLLPGYKNQKFVVKGVRQNHSFAFPETIYVLKAEGNQEPTFTFFDFELEPAEN